jgi:hypothetical protein
MKRILIILTMMLTGALLFAHADYDALPVSDWPFVNDDNVRIRTLPSIKYSKIITKLDKGTPIRVVGELDETETIDGEEYRWLRVFLSNGSEGWVYGKYISFSENLSKDQILDEYTAFSKAVLLGEDLYNELLYGSLKIYIGDDDTNQVIHAYRSSNEMIDTYEESNVYDDAMHGEKAYRSDRFSVYAFQYGKIYLFGDYDNFRKVAINRKMPNKYNLQVGMSIDTAKMILGKDIGEYQCDEHDYYIPIDDEHELRFKTENRIICEIILSFAFGGD